MFGKCWQLVLISSFIFACFFALPLKTEAASNSPSSTTPPPASTAPATASPPSSTTPPPASTSSIAASDYLVQITAPTAVPGSLKTIEAAIPKVFDIVIYSASIVFLVLFLVGGLQYLSSAGNEEASGKAKKLLVDAVVGLLIVVIAWAAGTWILGVLNINIVR